MQPSYFFRIGSQDSWANFKKNNPTISTMLNDLYEVSTSPIDFLQLMVSEGLSYHQISREMTHHGYRTPTGKQWTPYAVKRAAAKTLETWVS